MPRDGLYQASSEALSGMHRNDEADAALRKSIAQSQGDWPSSIAMIYAYRNQPDEAMKWLERAYQYRDESLYLIKGDPHFRSMESDPRFKAFLRKMNLPE
jgi:hypothetical protein